MVSPRQTELNNLLEQVVDLETRCQDIPGPHIWEDKDMYSAIDHSHDLALSEQVPTLAEFLGLLKIVGTMLEVMGAES